MTTKTCSIKGKIKNLDLINVKNVCSFESSREENEKTDYWETMFANHISTYLNKLTLKKKKKKDPGNPVRKWAKDMNIYFTKIKRK